MSIELPKDAEGREIPLDTTVLYDGNGQAYEIETYCYAVHEDMPDSKWGALLFSKKSVELKSILTTALYLTPPDSWEKLLDDLSEAGDARYDEACAYFHRDKDEGGCISCPGGEDGCGRIAMRNIASRIRKLRGEGE